MTSGRIQIADTLAAALSAAAAAGQFSQPFAAVRKYVPAAALADVAGVLVTVVPIGPERRQFHNRAATRKDFSVDVGVQKHLGSSFDPYAAGASAELDGLMLLVEQIADFIEPLGDKPKTLWAGGPAWTGTEIDPPYDLQHLRKERAFTSRLTVSYCYS